MVQNGKKISIGILDRGCPKLTYDLERFVHELKNSNIDVKWNSIDAQYIVYSSCAFLKMYREEALEEIENLKKQNKQVFITGCYAEYNKNKKSIDLYSFDDLLKYLRIDVEKRHVSNRFLTTYPYAFVKIAEGCDWGCSFCTIPYIKGSFRSRPMNEIVDEVKILVEAGMKEIILIGQDTGSYGKDIDVRFIDLLKTLDRIKGRFWIRLLYLYPLWVSERLLDFIANSEHFVPYINTSFQHVSNNVLKSMNRGYDREFIDKVLKLLKKYRITVRSEFITGYPDERERDFISLKQFLGYGIIDLPAIFMYSHEPFTRAYVLKDSDEYIKRERYEMLEEEIFSIQHTKKRERIGEEVLVLVDGKDGEGFYAHSNRDFVLTDYRYFVKDRTLTGSFYKGFIQDIEKEEYDFVVAD